METKHTPGPWLTVDGNFVYALHNHNGRTVNRFSAYIEHYPNQGGSPEEGKANALLIAASPDLLEALKNLVTCVDMNGNVPSWTGQWDAARAAIRKATHQD